jgi:hypothetical protein
MQRSDHRVRQVSFTKTVFAGDRNRLAYQHKQSDAPRPDERQIGRNQGLRDHTFR